jgi:hypothetical protein
MSFIAAGVTPSLLPAMNSTGRFVEAIFVL